MEPLHARPTKTDLPAGPDSPGLPRRLPVVLLTGFLGAGKTTLLNRLLTADHGLRIALIVNEFGEIGIDHHLLIAADQEILQLNNGCLCCSVRGDLLRGLFSLLPLRSQFDLLVIETTGLAEPAPVAQTFLVDDRIRSEFRLSTIVTVVDAGHAALQLVRHLEAREQVAFADLLLLNKTDLATDEDIEALEASLRALNRLAPIVRTKNSELDINLLLADTDSDLDTKLTAATVDSSGHHHHADEIATVAICEPGAIDGLRLSAWFRSLLANDGDRIMRMKGLLHLAGDSDRFIFQGVHMMFEGRPGAPWASGEERMNRLVFIGRELDSRAIVDGFRACLVSSADDSHERHRARQADVSSFTIDQIRYWMKQIFEFPGDAPIVVKEVPCMKPGCPPIETAIVVLLKHEPPRLFKIQQSLNDVGFDHVFNLIENPMPCC